VNRHPPLDPQTRLALLFVVLIGAALRLQWIQMPLLDGHRWRQVDTAAIARNLYENRLNVFYPQVDWGGAHGYVECEFPLMPAVTAALYHVFGPHDFLGRVVAVVFSVGTIVLVFLLAREWLGAAGGLAAAFLMASSPAAVFFGRTFMPDSPMLFFWIGGVLGFVRYFHSGSRAALIAGSAATALACLVKIPAIIMFAPIAAAAWQARGWSALRDRAWLAAVVVPIVLTGAWYVHAHSLYRSTGLTFGILDAPAKTYPAWIAPGPWRFEFSKWSTRELLTGSSFYMTLLGRFYQFLLLPWGFAGALAGLAWWRRDQGRLVADAWLAALVAFVLVAGVGNIGHDYYQLPFVPVAALYFGAVAGPMFTGSWRLRDGSGIARAAALAAIAWVGFYFSGVVNSHFRPQNPDLRMLQAGQAVARFVPPESLTVVTDDYGVTSPMLLYFAHRKGWSFEVENLSPAVMEGLRKQGARFFVSTVWSRFVKENPEAAQYLQSFQQIDLDYEPADTVLFDIGQRQSAN
jgi:4-amino-4-deoxy-L-arabinose transferase-like glycosyltransferase